jgi:hypothetical protein
MTGVCDIFVAGDAVIKKAVLFVCSAWPWFVAILEFIVR